MLAEAYRALTSAKDGPSIYDLCDPLLLGAGGGDAQLRKFYHTAIANPALRRAVAEYLSRERAYVEAAREELAGYAPFRKDLVEQE